MQALTILVGRLGSDPTMRYSPEGQAMTTISVATDHGFGEKKTTVWYRVTCWGKTAEAVNQYLSKGDIVSATGTLREPKPWQAKDGEWRASLELSAHDVRFIWTKKKEENGQPAEKPAAATKPAAAKPGPAETEDAAW
jgi:single-strand DNA-binding protein